MTKNKNEFLLTIVLMMLCLTCVSTRTFADGTVFLAGDPFDAEVKEVSGMISIVLGTNVVKDLHILTGVKPTNTPTPSPTPTPVPTATPTPAPSEGGGFQITSRMRH